MAWGAVALWSTVATAFKVALAWMSPLELMWLAALVSWMLMGAIVVKQGHMRVALRWGVGDGALGWVNEPRGLLLVAICCL